MMRVLVCGGRNFSNRLLLNETLDKVLVKYGDDLVIVHGAASGADLMSEDWAKKNEVEYMGFPAKWNRLGKPAGYERNARQRDEAKPQACIAFKGNDGTKMMIDLMRKYGVDPWLVGW